MTYNLLFVSPSTGSQEELISLPNTNVSNFFLGATGIPEEQPPMDSVKVSTDP